MARRAFLSRMAKLAALPFLTSIAPVAAQAGKKQLKILMKSAGAQTIPRKGHFRSPTVWRSPRRDMRCKSTCSARRLC